MKDNSRFVPDRNSQFIITTLILSMYIGLVFFFCLANFSNNNINLAMFFLGIRLDRILHFTMFFPYPFVCWLFLKYNIKKNIKNRYFFVIILISGILLAAIAESSQELLTSYRESDPVDMLANTLGILSGSILLFSIKDFLDKLIVSISRYNK